MEGPAVRMKAGTNQIAALTSLLPFGFGGMRGGMMRGRGGFRGQFGRGGGGGYVDEDMGQDFGPPGGPPFGPRRIGKHGGFNKRPRQDSERGFRVSPHFPYCTSLWRQTHMLAFQEYKWHDRICGKEVLHVLPPQHRVICYLLYAVIAAALLHSEFS